MIRDTLPSDWPQVSVIFTHRLGVGYLEQLPLTEDQQVSLVAVENDLVAGMGSGRVVSHHDLIRVLKGRVLPGDGAVGLIDKVAVATASQGHGHGGALVTTLMEKLAALGAEQFACLAWEREEVGIAHVLERLGFTRLNRMERYWFNDSLERGYDCPACGSPPCQCAAGLYWRDLG